MKQIATTFAAITALAFGQTATASDSRYPQVTSYVLDVSFNPDRASMAGTALIRFTDSDFSGDTIVCYLHGELRVDSVELDGVSSTFQEEQSFYAYDYSLIATVIAIPVAHIQPKSIRITYSGHFNPSKARSPSDYMRIDHDGVFLRAYGYSLWFPVFLSAGEDDYAVNFERVTTRLPRGYTGVFGGVRTGESVSGDTNITTWSAPGMRLFEAQFTARPYQVLGSEADFEVFHLSDSASTAAAHSILEFSRALCAHYGQIYRAPDAHDTYRIIETPPYGDISSGGVTGLMESTWKIFSDDENAQRALAHELVHPFVRLDIPRADSAYSLIVEGFPSYFHLPCVARFRGAEFYNRFVGWMEKLYLDKRATGKDRRGNALPPEKPLLAIGADELSTYKDEFVLDDRALLFLNYLRSKMGSQFDAFTQEMFNTGIVSVAQFRALIEKHLPGSGPDIRTWLETTEYPEHLRFEHFRMAETAK